MNKNEYLLEEPEVETIVPSPSEQGQERGQDFQKDQISDDIETTEQR